MARDDMTGIAAMLAGLVVLVLTGVGLSLVIDRQIGNSRQQSDLQEITLREEATVQSLREQLKTKAELANAQAASHDKCEAEYQSLVIHITRAKAKREPLLTAVAEAEASLRLLPEQFESYRKSYRQHTWQSATGETHRTIKLLSGRTFDNVVIKRVTDVGLEISHQDGIARIDAKDLDDSWQQRFQWDQTQRKATLDKENQALRASIDAHPEAQTQSTRTETTKSAQGPQPATPAGAGTQDVERMRAAILFWKGNISTLQSEFNEANHNRSYGKARSVPGSLESWDAKAVRVKAELVRAQASLQLATARLAAASPNDPLLHMHGGYP